MKKYFLALIALGLSCGIYAQAYNPNRQPKPKTTQSGQPANTQTPTPKTKTFTVNGVSFEMIFVEGGTFLMGCTSEQSDCYDNEKPTHSVTLSNYYIGKYPVTQLQWKAVMGSYPAELYNTGCGDCPVERVSWHDAQEFINKLYAQTGINCRLPTEAEWEYAARGGRKSQGYKYSGSNIIEDVAWYAGNYKNSKHGSAGSTHPVGTRKPNELGIYDMSGNVWEWCYDWYGGYSSYSQTNPAGPSSGSLRVLRGGSCSNYATRCRVANRTGNTPDYRNNLIGLRLVLVP